MNTIERFVSHSPFENGEHVAPSMSASEVQLGVSYHGSWDKDGDGFNEHVRRCARALFDAGCPVHLRSTGPHVYTGTPRELDPKLKPLLTASVSRYSTSIHQVILQPSTIHALVRHRMLTPEQSASVNRYKVLSTVFEKDSVPVDTIEVMKQFGQVWVACQKNAQALVSLGLEAEKVRVVPVPFFADDPLVALQQRAPKKGPVRFYHIGKWEPRKSQDVILRAFFLAFEPGQAQLVLRCNGLTTPVADYPQGPREAVQALLSDPAVKARGWTAETAQKSVEILLQKLSAEDLVKLHGFGDVYITLSRGEGFDMPAFDARLAGNLVVYTPSGGPLDFCGEQDVLVPATGSAPCHDFYAWEAGATYLDFSLSDAVEALRKARLAARQPSLFNQDEQMKRLDSFRAETVGQQMLQNLRDLVGPEGKVFER